MITSGISTGNDWLSQLAQMSTTNQSCSAGTANNTISSNDVGVMLPPGGKLLGAITAALSQIGVGGNSTSNSSANTDSSSSSAQDPVQALSAFMQDLMAALHSQSGAQSAGAQTGSDGDGDNDGSSASRVGASGRHRHHNIQADLQSLIQQLSASSINSSSASASTGSSNSTDSTLTSLEQSFQNLLDSLGGFGSTANLGGFLQAFAANMQSESALGNVVKAQA